MKSSKQVLTRVRQYFPQVNKVVDARVSKAVSVTKEDNKTGRKKDPGNCALARACTRQGADGAIINISFSYLIKGDVATRYKTSVVVGREITSFDRHQDFATGKDYLLSKVGPTQRLGFKQQSKKTRGPHLTKKVDNSIVHTNHRTSRIRVAKVK